MITMEQARVLILILMIFGGVLLFSGLFLALCYGFWRFCVRHYASSGS